MSPAYLHLLSAHLPVLGTVFTLLLFGIALLRRSEELRRTSLLAFLVSGLLALVAYLSGSPTVAQLKRSLPSLPLDACDQHAEVAILALTASLLLGVTSLAGWGWFRRRQKLPAGFLLLVLCLALVAAVFMGWAAHLGTRIRHPEIGQGKPDMAAARRANRPRLDLECAAAAFLPQPQDRRGRPAGARPCLARRSPTGKSKEDGLDYAVRVLGRRPAAGSAESVLGPVPAGAIS